MPSTRRMLSAGKVAGGLVPSKWDQLNPLYCANQNNLYINAASNLVANTYIPFPLTTNTQLTTQYFCSVVPFSSGSNSYICVWSVNYSTNTLSVANNTANFNGSTNFLPKALGGGITTGGVDNYSINLSNNLILTGKVESATPGLSGNIKFQSMLFNPSTNAISFGTTGTLTVSNLYAASWYQINSTAVILNYSNGISSNQNANNTLRVVSINPSTGAITFETANTINSGFWYRYGQKNSTGTEGGKIIQYQSVAMCNSTIGFIVAAATADQTSSVVQSEAFSLSGTSVLRTASVLTFVPPYFKEATGKGYNLIPVPLLRYPILLSSTSNVGISNTFAFIDGLMSPANSNPVTYINPNYYPLPGTRYYTVPKFNITSNTFGYNTVRYNDGSGPDANDSTAAVFSAGIGNETPQGIVNYTTSMGIRPEYVNENGDIRVLTLSSPVVQDGVPEVGNPGFKLSTNFGQSVTINANLALTLSSIVPSPIKCSGNSFNIIEIQGNPGTTPFYPDVTTSILSTLQGTTKGIFMGVNAPGGATTCQVVYRFLSADTSSQVNVYTVSNTYTAPRAGNVFIVCHGAGGYGNASSTSNNATTYPGGGGAFAYKTITVTNGQTIPMTIGASGLQTTVNTIVCNSGSNSTTSALGAGGVASGGDLNANGSTGISGLNANGSNGPLGYDTGRPGRCGSPGPARSGFGYASSQQVYGAYEVRSYLGTGGKAFQGVGQAGSSGIIFIGIK